MNTQLRAAADFSKELWIGMPKGGRTLGASDDVFLAMAGIEVKDKIPRIDDYRLTDKDGDGDMDVRGFDMKPMQALNLLSRGKLDCAIVGRDVVKEFNAKSRGQKGVMQAAELLDTGLSNCALTVAVKNDDPAMTAKDLDGRVVVTKYPEVVAGWARANKIKFKEIVSGINNDGDIAGGIEGYPMFDPRVTVIVDMVESGESLVRYGWVPLGMDRADWAPIESDVLQDKPKSERRKFIDLGSEKLQKIEGVIMNSSAVLVRNSKKLSDKKEQALAALVDRFKGAAIQLGAKPKQSKKSVAQQRQKPPKKKSTKRVRLSPGETSHGLIYVV